MNEALRYNEDKLRYDLLEPHSLEQLVTVFTTGARKYSERNWEKGMKWSKMLASLKRHIAAFEKGEDYDPETGLPHMSHAAWNAMGLVTYMKYHPEYDDRNHDYLRYKKIGLDIDGVLADFNGGINHLIGRPDYQPVDWEDPLVTSKFKEVKHDPYFWGSLKPLVQSKDIPFEPHCYITSRSIDPEITKEWLHSNGFPDVPIYSIGSGESKVDVAIHSQVDYFIDDYFKNFVELNRAGICTFLIERSWNSKYNVGYKKIKDFKDFKNRFL